MQTTTSLEQVSKMFQTWRETKLSKFEPTPNSLKILIKQLLPLYSKSKIMRSLGIGSRLLNTVIKPTSERTLKRNKLNLKINMHSNSNFHSNDASYNQDVSFMPFSLGDVAGNLTPSSPTSAPPTHRQDQNSTQCELIKPNGTRLVFYASAGKDFSSSSDLPSIIKAFVCSN